MHKQSVKTTLIQDITTWFSNLHDKTILFLSMHVACSRSVKPCELGATPRGGANFVSQTPNTSPTWDYSAGSRKSQRQVQHLHESHQYHQVVSHLLHHTAGMMKRTGVPILDTLLQTRQQTTCCYSVLQQVIQVHLQSTTVLLPPHMMEDQATALVPAMTLDAQAVVTAEVAADVDPIKLSNASRPREVVKHCRTRNVAYVKKPTWST